MAVAVVARGERRPPGRPPRPPRLRLSSAPPRPLEERLPRPPPTPTRITSTTLNLTPTPTLTPTLTALLPSFPYPLRLPPVQARLSPDCRTRPVILRV